MKNTFEAIVTIIGGLALSYVVWFRGDLTKMQLSILGGFGIALAILGIARLLTK